MHRTAVLSVCIALASLASLAHAQSPTRVTVRAMNLQIELPPGWVLDPNPGEFKLPGSDTLAPAGTTTGPTIEVLSGLGTCDEVIDRVRREKPPEPRLALIPTAYHPSVAYPNKGQAGMQYVHTCIGTGRETLHLRLRFMLDEDNSAVTTVLAAIARAYESRPVASRPTTSTRPAAPGGERRLGATGLVVTLPAGWTAVAETARRQPSDVLSGGGENVIVTRFDNSNCAQLIRSFADKHRSTGSPRPAFAPTSFYDTAVVSTDRNGTVHVFCRSSGSRGIYAIIATLALTDRPTPELVGTLHSVARAIDDEAPAPGPTSTRTVRLPRTRLTVAVPNGWLPQQSKDPGIDHIIGEHETVIVARIERTSDCNEVVRYYERIKATTARSRPSFAPASFHPRVVVSPTLDGEDAYTMCLSTPPIMYVIEAIFAPSRSAGPELVALLQSIADAIQPPAAAGTASRPTSGNTSVARAGMTYERAWKPSKLELPSANTFAFELRGTMLSPTSPLHSDMASSYGIAGGLARLKLGTPDDGMTLASELVAVGGYASASGITADLRAGIGAAFTAGERSRIGLLAGVGVDGIGIGQDEDDPERLVLPFGALFYATAAVRTSLGEGLALQLAGSYRARSEETEYLGEARVHVIGLRPWSIGAFYKDIELARVIGAGIALSL